MMSKTTCVYMLLWPPSSSIHHHYQNDHHGLLSPQPSVFLAKSIRGFPSLKFSPPSLSLRSSYFYPSCSINFHGSRFQGISNNGNDNTRYSSSFSLNAQMNVGIIGKAQKWWEKGLQPNMKEINGAQDLVDSLLDAGDKLVIVDFFSPGCGGCRALHPKICQFAEMNPDVQFLQVNYEEHKSMCYTLNVHVLPFFRFYRGAHGRLCSFSCTNATIKKFKDALAKHSPDRCSLGPPKGLEEKELLALSANKDLSFNYAPKPEQRPVPIPAGEEIVVEMPPVLASHKEVEPPLPHPRLFPLPSTTSSSAAQDLVGSGR